MKYPKSVIIVGILFLFATFNCTPPDTGNEWILNEEEYLQAKGLSVLAFHNYYPVGKQGGIEMIHHGERIATNGFIRGEDIDLDYPEQAERQVDPQNNMISSRVSYEDLDFSYTIRVWPESDAVRLAVDLDKPIPAEWENQLNFALEFYPPLYFGKSFQVGDDFGIIPREPYVRQTADNEGELQPIPLGRGKILTFAEEDLERKMIIESLNGELELLDERNFSYRGWIWVRSPIPSGVTENAIEWSIQPNTLPGWTRDPMIAISQVGYHPGQVKKAIVELDTAAGQLENARLMKLVGGNGLQEVKSERPERWGKFLRYDYANFDFTEINEPGMYIVSYGGQSSNPFAIREDIYKHNLWQPTLEGYFPIQMCHMDVRDGGIIWHGACHLDDALQAPLAIEHVDGYRQYAEAETPYSPGTTVPHLNQGGWHDAGDDDLAAGSQASTTHYLVFSDELYEGDFDHTSINYDRLRVEMRQADGIPDLVQQIKHGAINLLSGYRAAGHSFAGIIATREGRNIKGDWASQTDQFFYDPSLGPQERTLTHSGVSDDRLVFTNRDTGLEYEVAAALAAASRSLKGFDDDLSEECLQTAVSTWDFEQGHEPVKKPNAYVPGNTVLQEILATVELLFTTGEEKYATRLVSLMPEIEENMERSAWGIARVIDRIENEDFRCRFKNALNNYSAQLDSTLATNPFGVPWRPRIWGIGWDIQRYALEHFFLVKKYPDLFDKELVYRVVNYVLGCHPGSNTSLTSGVGAHSIISGFGVYRHMWYYIPGGMVSGTALIRPDFPELKEPFPYLWQQSEYVMPGAASYIFCVLAADQLLNR